MARPRIAIDPAQVEKLAQLHCTNEEMAFFFGCSADTLERRFAGIIAKGRSKGKMALRDYQWQAAKKGNVTMQIWLGKQLLGQKDKLDEPLLEDFRDNSIQLKYLIE